MNQQRSREVLFANAVQIITDVATLRLPDGARCDAVDFIAGVLSASAASLGGPECLLAGRPGSWEAALVRQLLEGTMGYHSGDWHRFRTEPLVITLNVAALIEDSDLHPGLLGYFDALAACDLDHLLEGHFATVNKAVDAIYDSIESRYRLEYLRYGARFTMAVQAAALVSGFRTSVAVEVDVDPESAWWSEEVVHNPDPWDDPIVRDLWHQAHDVVPLPNIDVARSAD